MDSLFYLNNFKVVFFKHFEIKHIKAKKQKKTNKNYIEVSFDHIVFYL